MQHMLMLETTERTRLLTDGEVDAKKFESWIDEARAITLEDPAAGLSAARELVRLCTHLNDPRLCARSHSALCHALSYSGEMREAIDVSREARALAIKSGDRFAQAEAHLTSVQSHNVTGKRTEALQFASEAGAIFTQLGDTNRSATATMLAGVVLRMLDRPTEAIERFDEALAAGDIQESLKAQIRSNRAEALLDTGRFTEARRDFERALEGFTSCGLDFGVAIVEGNLADLASRRGELHEALTLFGRASRRFRDAEDHAEAARLDAEAAELLLAIGDTREALQRLPAALATLERHGLQTESARARMTLGIALGKAGRFDEAIREIKDARLACLRHEQTELAARAGALHGSLLNLAGHAEDAIAVLTDTLHTSTLEPHRARLLLELCSALIRADRIEAAADTLNQASTLIDALGLADLDAERAACEIAISRTRESPESTRAIIDSALDTLDANRNKFPGDRLRSAMIGSSARLFSEAMTWARDRNDPHLALEISERASARSLAEQPAANSFRSDPEIAVLEGDVSATLHQIEAARSHGSPEAAINRLRTRLNDLQRMISRVELQAPAHRGDQQITHADPAALIERIPSSITAITFARAGDDIVSIAIQNNEARLSTCSITMPEAISEAAAALSNIDRALVRLTLGRSVSDRLNEELFAHLERLGTGLFGHLPMPDDPGHRLVVVLPRELSRVPITCLRMGGRSLVERATPIIAPSLGWAAHMHETAVERKSTLVAGYADDEAPEIENEIISVAKAVRAETVLTGDKTTLDALTEHAPSARIVHLACHGEYTPEDPMGSRLKLAGGWVSARQLAELDLAGAQVVLSGCETGSVDAEHAGEHFGLVRAVLLAGAQRVIASRWRLSDHAATNLFASFYQSGALSGAESARLESVLAALQSERSQAGDHPALWGGLFAVGSWN